MSFLHQRLEWAAINYLRTSATETAFLKADTGKLIATEKAFRILLGQGDDFCPLEVNLYAGELDMEVCLPAIVAIAESGAEAPEDWGTGNVAAELAVELRFPVDQYDPCVIGALMELSWSLMGRLWIADLADALSRHESGLTVQGVIQRQAARAVDGRTRIHRYSFQLYACPSDLLPA